MSIHSNNNDLNYLIDLIFIKVNRLFLLSFARITKKMIQQKITEILFHIIMYQMLK